VTYTGWAVLAVALALLVDRWGARTRLVGRAEFWIAYGIVLFFQLLTNGWLTGRHIVRYDPDAILGGRIAYAPVEDLLFGFALVLWTWIWWDWFGRREAAAEGQARRARR
jgi:lycopene cyclase domain-containing protein